MRGGLVFFRGAGAAARAYLEADHSNADEYYLAEGAVAEWSSLDASGEAVESAELDGERYQGWVDWLDPMTNEIRGVPRDEVRVSEDGEVRLSPASPRFVEMTVNVDKSLSVAAALDPRVSAALDAAERSAVEAMNHYMAEHSVTRVGGRGEQRLVPVDRLESVAVVHRSSRAGDPHRHVHVQWSTRVMAEGGWRGLHTAATLKQQGALRGVGEAAINSHAGLRNALHDAGFAFDAASGKVTTLAEHARVMSKRAAQLERNVAQLEARWRAEHPGQEPDKGVRREWDQQAWAKDRPRKRQAPENPEEKWRTELVDAGLRVERFAPLEQDEAQLTLAQLRPAAIVADAIAAAEQRSSAWSEADLVGHVGVAVGRAGVIATERELHEWITTTAAHAAAALPRLEVDVEGALPGWVRLLTSERVLAVEGELKARLSTRGMQSGLALDETRIGRLDGEQSAAARALAGRAPLVVVEGAAGAGKTTMLRAARELAAEAGDRFVIVAPTLQAAQVAGAAVGAGATSGQKLAHAHGFRWDELGRWSRLMAGDVELVDGHQVTYAGPPDRFRLDDRTRLVVDEAGMLDQDLALALVTIADETGAKLALVGDRAQLPAIGRGGVLELAVNAHPRPLDLTEVHRFTDREYAALTVQLRDRRSPGELFDQLYARGHIRIHDSEAAALDAIASDVVAKARAGADVAVAAASNESADRLNALIQDAHAKAGHTRPARHEAAGRDDLTLRGGDRIMVRRNDHELGVVNRETFVVDRVHRGGDVTVRQGERKVRLPAEYVRSHTHLAHASTEYGIQGATVDVGHGLLTDSSTAGALYVAATRGREENTMHVVADGPEDARRLFVEAVGRDAGDRGVDQAIDAVRRDVAGIELPTVQVDEQLRTERRAAEQRGWESQLAQQQLEQTAWARRHPEVAPEAWRATVDQLERQSQAATSARTQLEQETAAEAVRRGTAQWGADLGAVQHARSEARAAGVLGRRHGHHAAEAAEDRFRARHGLRPGEYIDYKPSSAAQEQWAAAAVKPGATAELDRARRVEQEARRAAEDLRADPPPATRPIARPKPGTPEQEAARDARFAQQRREQQQRQQDAARARQRPQGPTRAPEQGRGYDR